MRSQISPAWQFDELILALELYLRWRPKQPPADHPDLEALSSTLRRLPIHPPDVRRRQGAPDRFVYDDLHILVSLGTSAPGLAEGLRARVFEVQIRTGLQYAWWRATHDEIYKGGERTWRLQRVASQVHASLEMLDGVLAHLRTAATLLDESTTDEDTLFADVAGWLDRWPDRRRPVDVSRFVSGASALAKAAGKAPAQLGLVLDGDTGKALLAETDITPFQALLGAAVTEYGAAMVNGHHQYVLVTEELRRLCPATTAISRRATL